MHFNQRNRPRATPAPWSALLLAALLAALLSGTAQFAAAAKPGHRLDWSTLDAASLVAFPSGATPADRWGTPHDRVQGYLRKPTGSGPFPAVVLLHSEPGAAQHHRRWAERLAEWGYVALLVNSMRAGAEVSVDNLAHDAYGALRYLRGQTYVDPGQIAVIGWGMGGVAVLRALEADPNQPTAPRAEYVADGTLRFRGAIAYYAQCPRRVPVPNYAPALLLEGDKMFAGRTEDCAGLYPPSRNGSPGYRVKIYPDTTPAFDTGEDCDCVDFKLMYNPAAERDAMGQVRKFLASALQ